MKVYLVGDKLVISVTEIPDAFQMISFEATPGLDIALANMFCTGVLFGNTKLTGTLTNKIEEFADTSFNSKG